MRESDITAHLTAEVKARNWRAWKTNGRDGDCDWIAEASSYDGQRPAYGFLELKRPGQKLSEAQQAELADRRARGAYAGWADSRQSVSAFLDGLALEQVKINAALDAQRKLAEQGGECG